jgi:hypothetical protein
MSGDGSLAALPAEEAAIVQQQPVCHLYVELFLQLPAQSCLRRLPCINLQTAAKTVAPR